MITKEQKMPPVLLSNPSFSQRNTFPIPTLNVEKMRDDLKNIDNKSYKSLELAKMRRILRNKGVFYITNHGIPQSLIDDFCRISAEFYQRPLSEKLQYKNPDTTSIRGYTPQGIESIANAFGNGEYKDSLHRYSWDASDNNIAPNHEFQEIWKAYYNAQTTLATELVTMIAYALNLDDKDREILIKAAKQGQSLLRHNYYPADIQVKTEDSPLSMGPHADLGFLTLLYQQINADSERFSPLQAQLGQAGQYTDIPAREDTFVVNIGLSLATLLNNPQLAVTHRVQFPPKSLKLTATRISVAHFFEPNKDLLLKPLQSLRSDNSSKNANQQTFSQFRDDLFSAATEQKTASSNSQKAKL